MFALLMLGILTAACAEDSERASPVPPIEGSKEDDSAALRDDVPQWRSEHLDLPPEFAPGLPKGDEDIHFAPGMFDDAASGYWSYVFVMRLEDAKTVGPLGELLEEYYIGLVETVAASRGFEIDGAPAKVEVLSTEGESSTVIVNLIDPFVNGQRLTLNLDVTMRGVEEGCRIEVAGSPQPREHAIWKDMRSVLGSIP